MSVEDSFYLKDRTQEFLSFLFPGVDIIASPPKTNYRTNAIRVKNIVLFGQMSKGKTELVRKIAEEAVSFYGEKNVHAVHSEKGDLEVVMESIISNDKLVQLAFIDNFTLKEVPKSLISKYFSIRGDWMDNTGRNYGYIISIFGLHRFESTYPEFKSNFDGAIVKSAPGFSRYDKSVVRSFIGDKGLHDLLIIEEKRDQDPEYMSYSVFGIYGGLKTGLLKLDMASRNYLESVVRTTYPNEYYDQEEMLLKYPYLDRELVSALLERTIKRLR